MKPPGLSVSWIDGTSTSNEHLVKRLTAWQPRIALSALLASRPSEPPALEPGAGTHARALAGRPGPVRRVPPRAEAPRSWPLAPSRCRLEIAHKRSFSHFPPTCGHLCMMPSTGPSAPVFPTRIESHGERVLKVRRMKSLKVESPEIEEPHVRVWSLKCSDVRRRRKAWVQGSGLGWAAESVRHFGS